ncbi:MAG: hypothetical protein QW470_03630 [Candidatus Caldarchaeum sp.]
MARIELEKIRLETTSSQHEHINTIIVLIAIMGASNTSLRQIILLFSKSSILPVFFTNAFSKARILLDKWDYGQSEVLNFLTTQLKTQSLKNLIMRLSHALKAGVSLKDFAQIEYNKYLAELSNEFEKGLEKLRRLVEAYTTLISIVSLLMVSFLLVSTISGAESQSQSMETGVLFIGLMIGSTPLFFATNTLRRSILNKYLYRPRQLSIVERATLPVMAISFTTGFSAPFLSDVFGGQSVIYASLALMAGGAPATLHGFLGRRWHKKIMASESILPIFLKSFGDYLSATGSFKTALRMLSLSDFGPLNKLVTKFEVRLKAGLSPFTALKLFGMELLSKLGEKTFTALAEVLDVGATPPTACNIFSEQVSTTLLKDKRRSQVTSSLKSLAIPLHAVLSAIFALMVSLMTVLSNVAKMVSSFLTIIRPVDPAVAINYFYTVILLICLVTAVNIYLADGDSVFTLTFYFGLLTLVSGAAFLGMATASSQILSSFAGLSEIATLLPGG